MIPTLDLGIFSLGPFELLILIAGAVLGWYLRKLYDGTIGRVKRAKKAVTETVKDNPVTETGRKLFGKGKDLLDKALGKKPKDPKDDKEKP